MTAPVNPPDLAATQVAPVWFRPLAGGGGAMSCVLPWRREAGQPRTSGEAGGDRSASGDRRLGIG